MNFSRLSSTTGIDPSKVPKAPVVKAPKPAIPFKGEPSRPPANKPASDGKAQQQTSLSPALDMKTWSVDPLTVYKHITGKDLQVDEHSGMVREQR